MEIIKRQNTIICKHTLKRNEMYRFSKGTKFESLTILKKPRLVIGFSNATDDGKAILTIDYDNTDIDIVLQDYDFIQEKFNLPQAYLFKTKENNYHVICLKKMLSSEVAEILRFTHCDENYKTFPCRNPFKSWVLRISTKKGSNKPKFYRLIGKPRKVQGEISTAHKRLISRIYKIKHPKYGREDGLNKLKLHHYET